MERGRRRRGRRDEGRVAPAAAPAMFVPPVLVRSNLRAPLVLVRTPPPPRAHSSPPLRSPRTSRARFYTPPPTPPHSFVPLLCSWVLVHACPGPSFVPLAPHLCWFTRTNPLALVLAPVHLHPFAPASSVLARGCAVSVDRACAVSVDEEEEEEEEESP